MHLSRVDVGARAHALADRLVLHRRTIHRHPELAFDEHRTAAYIESVLDDLEIAHRRLVGTGVVAVLPGDGPRTVGVRAEMDALPVTEAPGRPGYRSEVPGLAHACGHDAHVAMALGLAELLSSVKRHGTVAFYFQPAEERGGGAAPMVAAGALEDPVPEAILALHTSSKHPSGTVAVKHGAVTAAEDTVTVTVTGRGGHAAHPHDAVDPVPIAAAIVTATQQLLTREVAPVRPAVVTYGSIHGGTRPNVIAPSVTLEATVRVVEESLRQPLLDRLTEVATGIAAIHRAGCEVEVTPGFSAGWNDHRLADLLIASAREVLGPDRVRIDHVPSMGAEDFFSFGHTGVPVAMFRLGVANPGRGITAPHHSPDFDLDETAMPAGVATFAAALRRLLSVPID